MGKSSRTKQTGKKTDLGKSLIKGKRQQNQKRVGDDCWRHTSELQDGADWGRLNLQSVTEQSNLSDFLMTAEMAGKEFTAEKQDVRFVDRDFAGVPKPEEITRLKKLQEENQQFLTIPRRPPWDADTSAEQLEQSERESFLRWRRSLAQFQESSDELLVTPYERNLNVWRQLWRVVERVDVVCQIVDARNPLLFACADLKRYVREIDPDKGFLLLINKSDYLSDQQRCFWADYFNRQNMSVLFWSALEETDIIASPEEGLSDLNMNGEEDDDDEDDNEDIEDEDIDDEPKEEDSGVDEDCIDEGKDEDEDDGENDVDSELTSDDYRNTTTPVTGAVADNYVGNNTNDLAEKLCVSPSDFTASKSPESVAVSKSVAGTSNSPSLIKRMELVEFFRTRKRMKQNVDRDYATIGLVGYPNVGKSSTINALLQTKKTAVSATPGKTKHFQTLFLGDDLQLCDCPGLVFPMFVTTKAEMVLNGILPIDQIIDYRGAVNQLSYLIPRQVLENTYGINIPPPREGEVPDRPPTAEEILSSYASMRGYMTQNGQPDCPRASRYILKDFIKGKLLYRHSPPGIADADYECVRMSAEAEERFSIRLEKSAKKGGEENKQVQWMKEKDEDFFSEEQRHAPHLRRPAGPTSNEPQQTPLDGLHKPGKKHGNKNKKEKLRRLYKGPDA